MYDLKRGTMMLTSDDDYNDNEYDDAIRSTRVVAAVVLMDMVLVAALIAGLIVWLL